MSKTDEQVVELDAQAVEAIAKQVKAPEIDYEVLAEKIAEKSKPADKEVNKLAAGKQEAKVETVSKYEQMSKEDFAVAQINAVLSRNSQELNALNDHALKTLRDKKLIEKATYLNVGTTADGGAIVPNADLLTDIFTTLSTYSALANELRVVNLTNGSSLDVATLTADVVMTEVGSEGGSKAVTKPTLGDGNVAVREFAGIALLTKKLVAQSAVDVYAILRDSFARAIAKQREQLILTDSASGIINKSGRVNTVTAVGANQVSEIPMATILAMPFTVPVASANGGIYAISRTLAGNLAVREDTTGRPLALIDGSGSALTGTFSNGYRFVISELLGTSDAAGQVHAVFGNFRQYGVIVRQGAVDSQVFDSGTVTDGASTVHNLIQENKLAMRVEFWENVGYPMPGAFATLTTGAAS